MGHPSDWDNVRRALIQQSQGHESHAVEIKPAPDWNTSIQRIANDIPEGSVVVGYSMGARLALGIAIEYPERIAGLVFVSGNPGLETTESRKNRWLSDDALAEKIENGISSETLESFLQHWYQQSVFAATPVEIRRTEVSRKLTQPSQNWPELLRTHSVSRQPNYWPRLNELSMPVSVVAGQDDEKYRNIAIRFIEEQPSSNISCRIIPACGHLVHRERPESLVGVIVEFMKGLR